MKTSFLVFSIMVIISCAVAKKKCRYPYQRVGNHCYYYITEIASADQSFVRCFYKGGYLANSETLEEALLVQNKLQKMNTGYSYNVGGRNINRYIPGGDWRWIKHGYYGKFRYYAFGNGEPSGSNSAPEDCMFLYSGDSYRVYDIYCEGRAYKSRYICEK